MVIERFNVFLIRLDPALGVETAKTRPCVIVSPDELNRTVATEIIAPMTTIRRGWPTRIEVKFQGKLGEIALDQNRAVDKSRLVKRLPVCIRVAGKPSNRRKSWRTSFINRSREFWLWISNGKRAGRTS